MDSEKYLTFRRFNQQAPAIELATLLKDNNIEYLLEDVSTNFDPSYANNEWAKDFRIKIKKADFEKTDRLLLRVFSAELDAVDKNYYLLDFTDEELKDVVAKRDEWGHFDFLLAQKLLKARGKEIKPDAVEQLKKQRIKELAKPDVPPAYLIYGGYLAALAGGLFGFFMGWHLLTFKKTLPNGERLLGYSAGNRKHGMRILIISTICFVAWLVVRLVNYNW